MDDHVELVYVTKGDTKCPNSKLNRESSSDPFEEAAQIIAILWCPA
jgi:hypothetical protein